MSNEDDDTKRDTLEKFSSNIQNYLHKMMYAGEQGKETQLRCHTVQCKKLHQQAQGVQRRLKLQKPYQKQNNRTI